MKVRVIDEITGRETVCDRADVALSIGDWFPHATRDMVDGLARLQATLNRGDYSGGWQAYLAIRIEKA